MRDPLADALTEYVDARWGSHLSPEQLLHVRSVIRGNLQSAEELRSFPVPMDAEPAWSLDLGRRQHR